MGGMADIGTLIYQAYVRELGDRLKPAALTLAKKIMDNTIKANQYFGQAVQRFLFVQKFFMN